MISEIINKMSRCKDCLEEIEKESKEGIPFRCQDCGLMVIKENLQGDVKMKLTMLEREILIEALEVYVETQKESDDLTELFTKIRSSV